ncbi:hypothetical protein M426DRAFT_318783 [Hypoxylon sp. CI-4A]|nr:hypothetical protein M426DRAFT_318783 [Hypoxylon sp. CI-4A]
MWLLDTEKQSLGYFNEDQVAKTPYAILSHVWGSEEILFHEARDERAKIEDRAGWKKITRFCAAAKKHGFAYAWVDTCCIDKRSSADLTEAINSMYNYYRDASLCFIYLEDVHPCANRDQLLAAVSTTRWLTRGWTLQELLASAQRCFFATDWSKIEGETELLDTIAESTGINRSLLGNRDMLRDFCIAERMKWAAKRNTTREEDRAYSLMGLFGVNIPALYGEGARNAFKRLQLEIMQTSFDMTIFAWRGNYESSGLLARSPADFVDTPPLGLWAPWDLSAFAMTNIGLTIRLNISIDYLMVNGDQRRAEEELTYLAALQCDVQLPSGEWQVPMIYLEQVRGAGFSVDGKERLAYRRIRCAEWATVPSEQLEGCLTRYIIVLQDGHYALVKRSTAAHSSRNLEDDYHGTMGKDCCIL